MKKIWGLGGGWGVFLGTVQDTKSQFGIWNELVHFLDETALHVHHDEESMIFLYARVKSRVALRMCFITAGLLVYYQAMCSTVPSILLEKLSWICYLLTLRLKSCTLANGVVLLRRIFFLFPGQCFLKFPFQTKSFFPAGFEAKLTSFHAQASANSRFPIWLKVDWSWEDQSVNYWPDLERWFPAFIYPMYSFSPVRLYSEFYSFWSV